MKNIFLNFLQLRVITNESRRRIMLDCSCDLLAVLVASAVVKIIVGHSTAYQLIAFNEKLIHKCIFFTLFAVVN